MSAAALVERLAWDSDFFKRSVARVRAHRLTPDTAQAIVDHCTAEGIDWLYFLADADDPATIRLAEDHGFRLVDVRAVYERALAPSPPPMPPQVRSAREDDIPALQAMSRGAFEHARFMRDPYLPREEADALYTTWVANSVHGFADAVLVVERAGHPAGYITLKLGGGDAPDTGSIALIAVDAAARGGGVGRALVQASLAWTAAKGRTRVDVVTQAANVPAVRLYERAGFVLADVQMWYHRWFGGEGETTA